MRAPGDGNPHPANDPLSGGTSVSTGQHEKLLAYRSVPTVATYLIVHQDIQRVERQFRSEKGKWERADHVRDRYIPIPCPETRLTLVDIYRGR